ncbi:MAG: sulfatase [Deltaproteobacteria bacterium]|nr:sulfatase [Deltaproteobacteria bacterium]
MARLALLFCMFLSASCGSGTAAPGDHGQTTDLEHREDREDRRGQNLRPASRASAAEPLAPAPARVRYDLAANLERAEMFEGESRVIDLRGPAGAKYTMGGWLSRMRSGEVVDGANTGVILGTRGRLSLPIAAAAGNEEENRGASIVISARAMVPGLVRAYVGEEQVGEFEVPRDAFAVVSLSLPDDALRVGDNTLLLRTSGTREVPDVGRVGLLVEWVKVTTTGDAGAPGVARGPLNETPPVHPAVRLGDHPALRLREGDRLGFALEVPEGARLRGVVTGTGDGELGELVVEAALDGEATVSLGATSGGPIDLDLGALAGKLCRIDLRARGGDVTIGRPTIVTTDAVPDRAIRERPRNVLVYLIDTLRADKLEPYSPDTRVRTPGLGRFVQSAATFLRAHTQENWTKPSVATLMSSLMPWQHTAVTGEAVVPASVTLLPEILKERGFYTGSFIANGYVSQAFGFHQGWDTYRNYIRENRRTAAEHVAGDVLRWLDDRPEDQPFFLYVHTIDPHVPYRPPNEFLEMYEETPYRGPLSFRRDATLLEGVKTGRIRTNARDRAHLEALYDGEISYHDVHFAAILDGLDRRGLADDTMVVVTADHGEEFWDHGSVGHGHNVYEELLHVPMFIRLPGLTDASSGESVVGTRRVEEPMGLVDVVPTVLEALGQDIPEGLAGRSVLPELIGGDLPAPPYAISGFMENWRTIVIGQTKLIQRTTRASRLYDLTADPGEEHDIAAGHPIAVRHARGLLGLGLAATSDRAHRGQRRRRAPRHEPANAQIDSELEAQLEALGYVAGHR